MALFPRPRNGRTPRFHFARFARALSANGCPMSVILTTHRNLQPALRAVCRGGCLVASPRYLTKWVEWGELESAKHKLPARLRHLVVVDDQERY